MTESLGDVIADRIRHYRLERGLSVRQLADACRQICEDEEGNQRPGAPVITQATLANIERGQRESKRSRREPLAIELPVIARALDVSPVLLLFRVGDAFADEVLPGVPADPFDAAQWFTGERPFPRDEPSFEANRRWEERNAPMVYMRAHRELVNRWLRAGAENEDPTTERREVEEALRQVRTRLRHRRLALPRLPVDLAHVDALDPINPQVVVSTPMSRMQWDVTTTDATREEDDNG